jgi:hypothetical protein
MMKHGRKFGASDSHPLPLWSGIMDHCGKIGSALWEFVWCLDKITEESDGIGLVLGGAPVKIKQMANDLNRGEHTVRRNLDRLQDGNYINRTRTPYGFTIRVRNSCKFQIWSRRENVTNGRSLPQESDQKRPVSPSNLADLTVKNGRNKEDATEDSTEDAAVKQPARSSEPWNLLGIRPEEMPPEFRELCEGLYATKGDQPMSEFVGVCMNRWEELGERQPREFVRAANRVRRQAKNPPPAPIKPLPEMPFQTKKVEQCQTKN